MTLQYICKNLVISLYRKNPLYLHKPNYASSITILFYSSSLPKISSKSSTTEVSKYLINQHQFSPEAALKVSAAVKYLKDTGTTDSTLLYLKEIGISKTRLEHFVARVPRVLSANLDRTIKPKIMAFLDLGITPTDVSEIISGYPSILACSANNRISPSILVLQSVLGSNADVSKVLKRCGWFLKHDLEKNMMPNIEFMKSCGISMSQLVKCMFNFPRFFLLKHDSIREFVKKVDEMGFDRKSKMFLYAIRVMSSMTVKNWELKLMLYRSLGFSEDDILTMFRRAPQVFAVSERKIKDVMQILLSSGRYDNSLVVHCPELLVCSIECKIKPRLRVLKILESKNLLKNKHSLTTVCKASKKQFIERYVLPYSEELGDELKL